MARAKTYLQRSGATKRLEFLTDGVFAIVAILLGWIHVLIPVIIYILTPIVFLFLPDMDLNEISDKENV
jgi:hypothetical protein